VTTDDAGPPGARAPGIPLFHPAFLPTPPAARRKGRINAFVAVERRHEWRVAAERALEVSGAAGSEDKRLPSVMRFPRVFSMNAEHGQARA
jgi:hypothetical protein